MGVSIFQTIPYFNKSLDFSMIYSSLNHQALFYAFRYLTCIALLALLTPNTVHAKTVIYEGVTEFEWVAKKIRKETESRLGSTLVVFDIDDTLLESKNFFGSDIWYNWQRGRSVLDQNGNSIQIESEDVMLCIHAKLGTLYELSNFKVTDSKTPDTITKLQQMFDTMALTSRSPDYRPGTERELRDAGISFKHEHLMSPHLALVYDFSDSVDGSPRPISYSNGIVMSTGLNKGRVLRDLLRRIDRSYTNIFFIDDGRHNVDNMKEEYSDNPDTHVSIFHYTRVPKATSAEKIAKAREASREFNEFIRAAFPDRFQEFAKNKCD